MSITVYTTPRCMQCGLTTRALEDKGISYDLVDLSEHPDATEYVTQDLGHTQAPIVVINDQEHWSGFRPDLIDTYAQALIDQVHADRAARR